MYLTGGLVFSFLLALILLLGTQVSKQMIQAPDGAAARSLSPDPDANSVPFLASQTNPSLKGCPCGRGQSGVLALWWHKQSMRSCVPSCRGSFPACLLPSEAILSFLLASLPILYFLSLGLDSKVNSPYFFMKINFSW